MTEPIQRSCKNCGAPLKHSYNHRCEYCGTLYDFNEPEENIKRYDPDNLVDVKLESVERSIIRNSFILYFTGYYLKPPKVYETNMKDNEVEFVSEMQNYINPPKVGLKIEVDERDLVEGGEGYLWNILCFQGLYHQAPRIMEQLKENNYMRSYLWR